VTLKDRAQRFWDSRNCTFISHRFQDTATYQLKITQLSHPSCICHNLWPSFGMTRRNFVKRLGHRNYNDKDIRRERILTIHLAVLTQYQSVNEWRTNRQTDGLGGASVSASRIFTQRAWQYK